MSRHESCHGCEGKGWVQIVRMERTSPWLDQITRKPVEGFATMSREYEAVRCPICSGSGTVNLEARSNAA